MGTMSKQQESTHWKGRALVAATFVRHGAALPLVTAGFGS